MAEGLSPEVEQALLRDGRRIVITGAGGWIGLATLDFLAKALGDQFEKRVRAFGSSTRTLRLADGTQVLQRPLDDMAWLPHEPTMVLHTAFLTKDRAEAMDEAQYRAANDAIRHTVLDALGPIGANAIFVASSGAASRAQDPQASAAMRLYGEMKWQDEDIFAAWAHEKGMAAVIARLYALAGPYINKPQNYAIASFMLDALAGRVIEVRSPHAVYRTYAAIREVISLVFALLIQGQGVTRFDSGGEVLELEQVACEVAALVDGATVHRAPITQPIVDNYHGDVDGYALLLEAHAIARVPLRTALAETLVYLKHSCSSGSSISAMKPSPDIV